MAETTTPTANNEYKVQVGDTIVTTKVDPNVQKVLDTVGEWTGKAREVAVAVAQGLGAGQEATKGLVLNPIVNVGEAKVTIPLQQFIMQNFPIITIVVLVLIIIFFVTRR